MTDGLQIHLSIPEKPGEKTELTQGLGMKEGTLYSCLAWSESSLTSPPVRQSGEL